jgi:NodT family efflux transporter outer membrane factor (OMF) lipoprotein
MMKTTTPLGLLRSPAWALVLSMILFLSGCLAVGPDYIRPETTAPLGWNTPLPEGMTAAKMTDALSAWWRTLNDPLLSSLIERAVAGNLDLKKARARVREARARRGIAQADLFPALNGAGSATWSRSGEEKGSGQSGELYAAGFDAGWELDIFGGLRRSLEAAEADFQASQEDLRNVLVTLLAEVALNYVDVRTAHVQIAAAEDNLEAQSETYRLTHWRSEAGLSDELAVQQARYSLENTRSLIPALRARLEQALNRIAILLGENPGQVHPELEKGEPRPVPPLNLAVGLPADLLRRRPDVRQAERQLAAQTARIGVATADLYPKFTLNGSIGLEALSLSSLSSGIWSLAGGPKITWAIFKGGAIRQNIEVQAALQEQYFIAYEAAVLTALEEVENALVAYAEVQQRSQSLREAAEAARKAVILARYKFEAGLTDFNNVLDAQRSLLSFEEQLAQSEGSIISNLVRLYKALGGGWTSPALDKQE